MNPLYGLLAAVENGESMTTAEILQNAGETILIGVVVVFSVLILLTIIFYVFGWIMDRIAGKPKASDKPKETAPKKAAAPAAPVKQAASVTSSAEDEVIAVIAAAIAAMGAAEGKKYAIKKVTRVRGERSAWAMAGLAESTRPF